MTNKSEIDRPEPPKWADRFLKWYCSDYYFEEVQGDLHEWFYRRVRKVGQKKARLYYAYDVITYLRLFRIKDSNGLFNMKPLLFFNYLKIALRLSRRNLGYSLTNTLGLAVGLLSTLFISLYILDELSYDRFHHEPEQVYRLLNNSAKAGRLSDLTPSPWKKNMIIAFPEVTEYTRMGQDLIMVEDEGRMNLEHGFFWADNNYLTFFDFQVLAGDRATMLSAPNAVVLTRSKAMRYFERIDVVGEELPIRVYDGNRDFLMKVTGVIEDLPGNSHIQFDLLGAMSTTREMYADFERYWGLNWLQSYVRVAPGTDMDNLAARVPEFFEQYRGEGASAFSGIIFQPLLEVRLHSKNVEGDFAGGDIDNLYLFAFLALLILLASCLNYINLTTAKAAQRGKEVGMRKVFGARREQVAGQFYTEFALQLLIAFAVSLTVGSFLLPAFNQLVEKEISIEAFFQARLLMVMGVVYIVMLGLSGFYPAVVLNRFKPVEAVKRDLNGVLGRAGWVRRIQVLVQFAIAIFLIASTLIVLEQVHYVTGRDKGFNDEQLINIAVDDRALQTQMLTIKSQMAGVPGVEQITVSGEALPSAMNNSWNLDWEGKPKGGGEIIHVVAIDYDYLATLEANLLMGRNLSADLASDSSQVCLINASAFHRMGWTDLADKKLRLDGKDRQVVGVVEDFHYDSFHNTVAPCTYVLLAPGGRASPDNLILRMSTGDLSTALDQLTQVWAEFSDQPFTYSFVDEAFGRLYGEEQSFLRITAVFTTIGIVLGVLGLVGLISFVAERRSKEISIRKVLGAGFVHIFKVVFKPFLLIFVVGLAVSLPLSRLAMQQWLESFAYQVPIGWTVFAMAVGTAGLILIFSVGGHIVRITRANPVKHLSDQ